MYQFLFHKHQQSFPEFVQMVSVSSPFPIHLDKLLRPIHHRRILKILFLFWLLSSIIIVFLAFLSCSFFIYYHRKGWKSVVFSAYQHIHKNCYLYIYNVHYPNEGRGGSGEYPAPSRWHSVIFYTCCHRAQQRTRIWQWPKPRPKSSFAGMRQTIQRQSSQQFGQCTNIWSASLACQPHAKHFSNC